MLPFHPANVSKDRLARAGREFIEQCATTILSKDYYILSITIRDRGLNGRK